MSIKHNGKVAISKSTQGEFYIELDNKQGDRLGQAILSAENFAYAISGQYVDANVISNESQKEKSDDLALVARIKAIVNQCVDVEKTQKEMAILINEEIEALLSGKD